MDNVILETERTVLRSATMADLDAFAEMYGDAETMRFITGGRPRTREETRQRLSRMIDQEEREGFSLWAVMDKASRRVIGRCGLIVWVIDERREVELGYMIRRDCWGQGLAREVAFAIRDYAFETLGLKRLISLIDHDNHASRRVAEKTGLRHERDVFYFDKNIQMFSIHKSSPDTT